MDKMRLIDNDLEMPLARDFALKALKKGEEAKGGIAAESESIMQQIGEERSELTGLNQIERALAGRKPTDSYDMRYIN
jgi:hypothetical protein